MKNILAYLLLLVLFFSCNTNDFSETERYFVTDKETYRVNDNFEITIVVSPKNGEKKIRILKNLNNLNIYFSLKEEDEEFSQQLKKHFIEGPSLTRENSVYIYEYTISKTHPFQRTFKGEISETTKSIILEIPELKISDSIWKAALLKDSTITIKGYCSTVDSGIEESFVSKDIKILMK